MLWDDEATQQAEFWDSLDHAISDSLFVEHAQRQLSPNPSDTTAEQSGLEHDGPEKSKEDWERDSGNGEDKEASEDHKCTVIQKIFSVAVGITKTLRNADTLSLICRAVEDEEDLADVNYPKTLWLGERQTFYEAVTQSTRVSVATRLPDRESTQRQIQRAHVKKGTPLVPEFVTDNNLNLFNLTHKGESFPLKDSERKETERIIAFATLSNVKALASSLTWLGNGTFSVAPTLFFQVYTVYTVGHGCIFHFGQNVFRKIQEFGSAERYHTDEHLRGQCKMALASVPP
ncbi:hypothetical protein BV898_15981 [Hypsibius exemplaris]|uniref:Uncharacterized protein n=1 Tax=Hypsibius exemplaris TaxID=2072580 RepID=A0A9X6RL94_HYPEX|nr:hypothetical protein BV898_15981 [Hypsibius exemplaris]